MANTIYDMAAGTFGPALRTLSGLLDKGAEHARGSGRDPDGLLDCRLAPDMLPLVRQVQIACDQAKGALARLAGKEPPKIPDEERTLAELKARIDRTAKDWDAASAGAFDAAGERRIVMPLMEDMELAVNGLEYLRDWALPHFYFHLVTAYDILRHEGTPIGKRDYLAHVAPRMRQKA